MCLRGLGMHVRSSRRLATAQRIVRQLDHEMDFAGKSRSWPRPSKRLAE
jgi:hypothetical protein